MIETAIVGAGLAGASVGWHLGGRVVLFEQGRQPAAEASAQNAGMIRRTGHDPVERALAWRTWRRLEGGPGEDWPEPPGRRTGAVVALVDDPEHLNDPVAHLRARGEPVEALACPAGTAPVLAGSPTRRAWWVPGEWVVDPHALATGFLRGVRRRGGEVRLGVGVEAIAVEGGRVAGLRTSEGPVACDRVVVAAGAWGARLAGGLGLRRPLVPLRRHLLHGGPHPLSQPDHPWVWLDDAGLYVRPEAGGWLVSPCDERPEPPPSGPGSTGPVEPAGRALAMDRLERLLPALAGLRLARGWTGLRTWAPDRRPLLGPDGEVEGLAWAAGLGGFGVTACFGVGEAVAAWMEGRSVPWLRRAAVRPDRWQPGRFTILPDGTPADARLVAVPG